MNQQVEFMLHEDGGYQVIEISDKAILMDRITVPGASAKLARDLIEAIATFLDCLPESHESPKDALLDFRYGRFKVCSTIEFKESQ
jgi:hypothetical protein